MKNLPKNHTQHRRTVGISFRRARTGDVGMGNVSGGDQISGVSGEAVLDLLEDALLDERQTRRLIVAAIEDLQNQITNGFTAVINMVRIIAIIVIIVSIIAIRLLVLAF